MRRAVRADPEDFTMGFLGKARVKRNCGNCGNCGQATSYVRPIRTTAPRPARKQAGRRLRARAAGACVLPLFGLQSRPSMFQQ
ncbi:hypothetical protein FCJ60_23135 [Burkholderia metallica]|nr:hypothetical protein [Burkholderia metallica]